MSSIKLSFYLHLLPSPFSYHVQMAQFLITYLNTNLHARISLNVCSFVSMCVF